FLPSLRRAVPLVPLALLAACAASPRPASLVTEAERTGFARTGRYAEVERLCLDFEQTFPGRASCVTFGTTPERRPMLAIVASDDGTLDPDTARASIGRRSGVVPKVTQLARPGK